MSKVNLQQFSDFNDEGEQYRVSFDKPITRLKENNVIEVQPEVVKLGSADITPLIKNEIIEKEKQKSSEFHEFKDIDVSNSLKLFFPKLIEEKPNSTELIKTRSNEIEINDENIKEILDSGFIDNTSTINEQFFTGGANWYLIKV